MLARRSGECLAREEQEASPGLGGAGQGGTALGVGVGLGEGRRGLLAGGAGVGLAREEPGTGRRKRVPGRVQPGRAGEDLLARRCVGWEGPRPPDAPPPEPDLRGRGGGGARAWPALGGAAEPRPPPEPRRANGAHLAPLRELLACADGVTAQVGRRGAGGRVSGLGRLEPLCGEGPVPV